MPTVTEDNLGAWLIKCDPTTWDLAQFIADGNEAIDNWSVRNDYRSRMMRPDDKIIFWVSGTTEGLERGIWGIGHVTELTHDAIPSSFDPYGYWLDEAAADEVTNYAQVHIPLLDAAVTAAELRAAAIGDLEVQVVPAGSNPSWVSKDQLARIEALLPPWPSEPIINEPITVSPNGAGFGTPAHNATVEDAAMVAVMDLYEDSNWAVEDVSLEKTWLGRDLHTRQRQDSEGRGQGREW